MALLQRVYALGHPWCRGPRVKEKARGAIHKDTSFLSAFEQNYIKNSGIILLPENVKTNPHLHFKASENYSGSTKSCPLRLFISLCPMDGQGRKPFAADQRRECSGAKAKKPTEGVSKNSIF